MLLCVRLALILVEIVFRVGFGIRVTLGSGTLVMLQEQ
jgi:hypothetical protein